MNGDGGEMGSIYLLMGPMFAGKSTELALMINRYRVTGKSCIIIKSSKDTRYSRDKLTTHDMTTYDAISTSSLWDVKDVMEGYDVIGIDEGQFFYEPMGQLCEEMANKGKIVIVSALNGTFERDHFNKYILDLIPLVETIIWMKAVCTICGGDASFSVRRTNHQEKELIGGENEYYPACRRCYFSS